MHEDRKAFGEWVRDLAPWEAFGTFTFTKEVSVWVAARSFENFVGEVIPWVKCFYSVERHRSHGGHLHALLSQCGELTCKRGKGATMLVTSMKGVDVWQEWYWRYGRNSVEVPRDRDHTAGYCGKYLAKAAALWNHNLAGAFEKLERGNPMRVSSVTAWAAARERRDVSWAAQWVFPGASVES
jgi:hypothetical protein